MNVTMLGDRLDLGGGGVVTAMNGLAGALAARQHRVRTVGLRAGDGAALTPPPGVESVLATRDHAGRLACDGDVLHQHGLWGPASRLALRHRRAAGIRVISPHGMLDPWALALGNRIAKRAMLALVERRNLGSAHCLHALTEAERDAFDALALRSRVAVIPNGIDVEASHTDDRTAGASSDLLPTRKPYLLYLGRLAAIKGLPETIDAWCGLSRAQRDGWQLVVAGFGDAAATERVSLAAAAPDNDLSFVGSVRGGYKRALLSHASGFILASRGEGQPMAALEAMGAGVPALLSDACNLAEAFAENAARRAGTDTADIAHAIETLIALSPGERSALGERARRFVERDYSWPSVALRFERLYRWLRDGGDRPPFVREARS